MRWQPWTTVVVVVLASSALAWWQHHEYLHERELVRETLHRQAHSVMNALVGGIRAHRNRGPFFAQQLEGSLKGLVETPDILAVAVTADDGRLVIIAFLGGAKVELNFSDIMRRRLVVTGSTLRPQSDYAKAEIAAGLRAHVWPMLAAGTIGPVMDSTFPLEQAADAHRRLEEPGHIGKIVLEIA